MKDKILSLIVGILIGAIITTSVFLMLGKNNQSSKEFDGRKDFRNMQDFGGERPDFENMPEGERPELPEGMDESEMKNQRGPKMNKNIETQNENKSNEIVNQEEKSDSI